MVDLALEERIALLSLLHFLVRMDGVFSATEVKALTAIAREVGSAEFWATMREVQQQIVTADDMVRMVEQVERREVKDWIYGVLVRVAEADGMDESEVELLAWVRETWELDATSAS